MTQITKKGYAKLINDDAKWLVENTEDSLERKHILEVLWASIENQYPSQPKDNSNLDLLRCDVTGNLCSSFESNKSKRCNSVCTCENCSSYFAAKDSGCK